GIGLDGRVGMYVEEKDRSWCTSSGANDHRAVTIEVASDTTHPYAVKDAAFSALLDLCTDICKRNGKKRLLWFGDKDKTLAYTPGADEMVLTVHRWFANKACPGEYLYSRHGEIAEEVTKRLAEADKPAGTGDNPSKWAETATAYCKRKGIFAGDGAGNFDWQEPISREQVAAVIYRTLEAAGLLEALPDKA
ncbi:MAG: N-acetylmuramoyl-L-alanine amidase, partial [Lachnospiraceae bacterium]|nr:N-acetylmuramoyl-L-alanine amidase [Lachnospiraceae bacterium]